MFYRHHTSSPLHSLGCLTPSLRPPRIRFIPRHPDHIPVLRRKHEPTRMMRNRDLFIMDVIVVMEAHQHGVIDRGGPTAFVLLNMVNLTQLRAAFTTGIPASSIARPHRPNLPRAEQPLLSRDIDRLTMTRQNHARNIAITQERRQSRRRHRPPIGKHAGSIPRHHRRIESCPNHGQNLAQILG